MIIKPIETRYEIALKVFQWNPEIADLSRVAEELAISSYRFNTMSDEDFFHELYSYFHNKDKLSKI